MSRPSRTVCFWSFLAFTAGLTQAQQKPTKPSKAPLQASAQDDRTGTPIPRVGPSIEDGGTSAPSTFGVYHKMTSRALFRACDLNGNDRILPREALRSFRNFDMTDYRKFDENADGRIEFDEFDRKFRETTRFGGEITVTERARKRLPSRLGEKGGYPAVLVNWFALLDTDANDKLGRDEFSKLAVHLEADTFQRLDKNLDDGLSISEMLSLVEWIELIEQRRPRKGATQRPLPIDFKSADLDADNLIDQAELERALFRIDPMLPSHARAILKAADQNSDLFLDRFEIVEAQAKQRRLNMKEIPESLRKLSPLEIEKLLETMRRTKGNAKLKR